MRLAKVENPLKLFRPLLGIFLSLGAMKAAQILLPLLAIPWLARVLDMRAFGILMYFSILPSMVETILNWGFNLGALRDVAFYRDAKKKPAVILGAVISAKLLLSAFCLLGALALLFVIPHAKEYPGVYFLAILYGVARGFRPLWFYQGIGRNMRHLAIWDIMASLVILILIVVVINKPDRWPFYFAFNFVCKGLVYSFLTWELSRTWPFRLNLKKAWSILGKTRTLFANSLTNLIHSQTSKLILGFFLTAGQMGIYLAADKIIKAVDDAAEPIYNTIYPEICATRHGDAKTAGQMLFWSFIITVGLMSVAAILLWLLAPWLIPIALGSKYGQAIPILNIMLIALPIMSVNSIIGVQILVANGYERAFFLSSVFAAAASVPLAMFLPWLFGLNGAAWLNIILSLLLFISLLWYVKKYRPQTLSLTSITGA